MSTLPHDVYDRSLKRFWDLDPRPLLKLAFGEEEWTRVEPRPVEVVQTLKQVADRLAYVEGPEGPFFAHVEFERRPGPDLSARMFQYNVLLWAAQKGVAPVRSAVILLEKAPVEEELRLSYGSEAIDHFRYRQIRLYEVPAEVLANSPELAPLTPLGAGCSEQVVKVATETLSRSQDRPEDSLALLYLLGRVFGMTDAGLGRILKMEVVRMSDVYQEIMEEGRLEGLQKGRQEGLLRALAQVLTLRYPQHARDLDDLLPTCKDDDLEWLVGETLKQSSFGALRKQLEIRLSQR